MISAFSRLRRFRVNSLWLVWFVLHFLLILAVASHELFWLVQHGLTLLPSSSEKANQKESTLPSEFLGVDLPTSNLFRQTLATYATIAGIDAGYGYFAPNVPGTYRLTFELRYPDGKVERTLPRVHSRSAGLRIAGLLDEIGRTQSDFLREHMIKMMAQSIWRTHPDVKAMRAVLEEINLPSVKEFQRGKGKSSQFLYAYDFSVAAESASPKNR